MIARPKFSIFTASAPLTKRFELVDGNLVKHPGGHLASGRVETVTVDSAQALADILPTLTENQALGFGVLKGRQAQASVVTQAAREKLNDAAGVIARTREHLEWPAGPAVMMIDYDPRKDAEPLTDDKLLGILAGVSWALAEAPHVLAHSASSFVYNGDEPIRGLGGRRVYFLVRDGRDIPRAGKALYNRLWLAGYGYVAISAAGTMLDRTLVDSGVWQPERLDFASGAACEKPLEQRRPEPVAFNNGDALLDTREALRDLTPAEEVRVQALIRAERERVKPEADLKRRDWIERRVKDALEQQSGPDEAMTEAELREQYRAAEEHGVLDANFVLYDADRKPVSVKDMLADPALWHQKRFADPLEPGCYHDWRIAWANLKAEPPYLFSHAHGGRRYALRWERPVIKYVQGERVLNGREMLDIFRRDGDVFERGGELVRIEMDGAITPLSAPGVLFEMDARARWQKFSHGRNDWLRCDAPRQVAEALIEDRSSWRLPALEATISAPTMTLPDGRIIESEGFDAQSGLFFRASGDFRGVRIPEEPTTDDVRRALGVLWKPFEGFPFDGPLDRGVMLSAILTAITRPALPTAPAFAFVAPVAGSGKTLLARCLAILAGATPAVLPPADKNDEEMRKRLLSLGRVGAKVILLDNLTGGVASDCLCGWLTSPNFTDRVLGQSQSLTVSTRSLLLLTGNNIQPRGDLCRRVLPCRIDPRTEKPWQRGFDLDPAEFCAENRFQMVEAGLTVLRAGLQGEERPKDRIASFEIWSDSVRRAVAYAKNFMELDDPAKVINSAFDDDPETGKLRTLLEVCFEAYGETSFGVADLCASEFSNEKVTAILLEIAGEGHSINARRLGRWIERHAGRIVNDLALERAGKRSGSVLWRVRNDRL